jgi:hypothetical protein
MSINRVVSLAAAVVIGAAQLAVFSCPPAHAYPAQAVAAVADDASDGALPVVIVTAHSAFGRM